MRALLLRTALNGVQSISYGPRVITLKKKKTLPLNGSDLISAAQTEKEGLITELKEILDTMSIQAQLERKQAEADALQSQFNKMPMKIYIG